MAFVEVFLNRGLTLYNGHLSNFNRSAFQYESQYDEEKTALTEAYRIINLPSYELSDFEADIQREYLVNNDEMLDIGDVIAVNDSAWVYTPNGMKKL